MVCRKLGMLKGHRGQKKSKGCSLSQSSQVMKESNVGRCQGFEASRSGWRASNFLWLSMQLGQDKQGPPLTPVTLVAWPKQNRTLLEKISMHEYWKRKNFLTCGKTCTHIPLARGMLATNTFVDFWAKSRHLGACPSLEQDEEVIQVLMPGVGWLLPPQSRGSQPAAAPDPREWRVPTSPPPSTWRKQPQCPGNPDVGRPLFLALPPLQCSADESESSLPHGLSVFHQHP